MRILPILFRGVIFCICIALYSCDKDCSPATQKLNIAPGDTAKLVYKGKDLIHFTYNGYNDTTNGVGSTLQIEYNTEQDGGNCNSIQFIQEQRSVFFVNSTRNDFRIGIKTVLGDDPRYFISFASGPKYSCSLKKFDGPADIDTLTINHIQYHNIYKVPGEGSTDPTIISLYNKSFGLLHTKLPNGQTYDIVKK